MLNADSLSVVGAVKDIDNIVNELKELKISIETYSSEIFSTHMILDKSSELRINIAEIFDYSIDLVDDINAILSYVDIYKCLILYESNNKTKFLIIEIILKDIERIMAEVNIINGVSEQAQSKNNNIGIKVKYNQLIIYASEITLLKNRFVFILEKPAE